MLMAGLIIIDFLAVPSSQIKQKPGLTKLLLLEDVVMEDTQARRL
jgi:hypothetical protein